MAATCAAPSVQRLIYECACRSSALGLHNDLPLVTVGNNTLPSGLRCYPRRSGHLCTLVLPTGFATCWCGRNASRGASTQRHPPPARSRAPTCLAFVLTTHMPVSCIRDGEHLPRHTLTNPQSGGCVAPPPATRCQYDRGSAPPNPPAKNRANTRTHCAFPGTHIEGTRSEKTIPFMPHRTVEGRRNNIRPERMM